MIVRRPERKTKEVEGGGGGEGGLSFNGLSLANLALLAREKEAL